MFYQQDYILLHSHSALHDNTNLNRIISLFIILDVAYQFIQPMS